MANIANTLIQQAERVIIKDRIMHTPRHQHVFNQSKNVFHYAIVLALLVAIGLASLFGPQAPAEAQSVSNPFMIQPSSSLIPDGIGTDDKFRLIFITSTQHTADSTDSNTYNTLVQTAAGNNNAFTNDEVDSNTIANIKIVGSTSTIDARDNTAMWNNNTSTWQDTNDNVPIYWVSGDKVADSYADFYDGSWKPLRQNLPRDESGNRITPDHITVWTGSNDDGTKHNTNPLGASQVLWGAVGLVTGTGINPIGNTNTSNTASNTTKHRLYGITPVFQVEKTGILFDDSRKNLEVGEGDGAKVTLHLTAPAQEDVTITVNTKDKTATAPADYTAGPYQVKFTKGEQSKTFTIPTAKDSIDENVEMFEISIQTNNLPGWLNLLSTEGSSVSIWEKVELTIAPMNSATEVVEGGEARFTITANQSSDIDLEVKYRVTDGPGHDYIDDDKTGLFTATIPAEATTATIKVETRNDGIDQPAATGNGQITVTIDPHYNGVYTLGSANSVNLPIYDSQATLISATPVIGGNPEHLVEGGIYQFNTTLSRELIAPEEITIPFTFGGTATYGTDYKLLCPRFDNLKNMKAVCNNFNGNSPSITFTGGDPTENTDSIADIQMYEFLQVLTDSTAETAPETITITLDVDTTSGVNLHGGAQGTIYSSTIQDPPATSTVQFSKNMFVVNEASGLLEATVTLSAPLGSDLTLPITITEQGATRGTDFLLADNGIVIKAGESTATFSANIPNDDLAEGNEQFTITINANQLPNSPTAITTGSNAAATVLIIDDEPIQVTLDASRKIILEGGEDSIITLTLNRPLQTGEALTVPVTVTGDADQGTDYTLTETAAAGVTYTGVGTANATVSFAPSTATTATLTLNAPDDSTIEADIEAVTVTIGDLSFTKTDTRNPDPVTQGSPVNLYLFDPSNHVQWITLTPQGIDEHQDFYIGEENAGTLQVSLDSAPTAQVTAQVTISTGSSHATISGGPLTFSPTDYTDEAISILGTPDSDTNELDTVIIRFTLSSTDERYNGKTYDKTVQIVDNDTPITIRLTGPPSVNITEGNQIYRIYFTSSRRIPFRIPTQTLSLGFTITAGNFIIIPQNSDPEPADHDIEWKVEQMQIGENRGYIEIETKDDNKVEQDAAATATLSLIGNLPGITIDPAHNILAIKHIDDDSLHITINKQKQYLFISRKRDFPLTIEPKTKSGSDSEVLTMEADAQKITFPDLDALQYIVVRTPNGFATTRPDLYQVEPTIPRIILLSHNDPVPSIPEIRIRTDGGITEGSSATFTLSASPVPTADLPVTVSITASGNYGITAGSQTVTIPTSGTATLTIPANGDQVDEPDGSVTVTVTAGSGYTISSTQGTATTTIADDDGVTPSIPEIRIRTDGGITEGSSATFTLSASPVPTADLPVTVSITASGNYGITAGSQTVTIPTSGTATLTIPANGDQVDEPDGSVTVTVTAGSGYTISSTQGTATTTIADDDGVTPSIPEIRIRTDGGITEGSSATFTLSASPVPTADLPVTVSITASGNYGITAGSQTVTIPTSGTATLTIPANGDQVDEPDGSVTVTVTAGSGYTISSTQGTATTTIADDDGVTPSIPEIRIRTDGGITEGSSATFTLSASPVPTADLPVTVSITASGNYGITAGSQTVTIPTSGTATLTIPANGDQVDEPDGSVTVTVTAGSGYTISSTQGTATTTIADDDGVTPSIPEIRIRTDGGITEGSSATFTLSASPVPTADLPVTVSITASGNYGITAGSQTVTIPTSGTATLTIPANGDQVDEPDGSVTVTVTAGSGYTISSTQGTATTTIADDDGVTPSIPEIRIRTDGGITEGSSATFTLSASPVPTADLPVTVSITASGNYGITAGSQTVTIPTSGTATLTIPANGDQVDEPDGSVTVTVTAGSGYTISSTQGTATTTIADDDDTIAKEKISLSVISITSDSATATWPTLPKADQYTVRWWKTGAQSNTSQYQFVSTNYKKIDGLRSNTAYAVEVIPRVDNVWQQEQKSIPVPFTTLAQ